LSSFWSVGSRRWFSSTDGAFFLPRLFAWVSRPWLRFLGNGPKNNAPHRGAARVRCFSHFFTIYHIFRQLLNLAALISPNFGRFRITFSSRLVNGPFSRRFRGWGRIAFPACSARPPRSWRRPAAPSSA